MSDVLEGSLVNGFRVRRLTLAMESIVEEGEKLAYWDSVDVIDTRDCVNSWPTEVRCSDSTTGFSGFQSVEHHVCSNDNDSQDDVLLGSVLLQCAKTYGPVGDASVQIDKQVADMVNHVFDYGLQKYKEILDDDSTKRPSNCHFLAPIECNLQVLDVLKTDAKKTDIHMKKVASNALPLLARYPPWVFYFTKSPSAEVSIPMRSAVPVHTVSCWFAPIPVGRSLYCSVFFCQSYCHVIGDNAKDLGPPDTVSGDIDNKIAGMVNFLFDKGMQEEDYKAISEDGITTRPNNCPALAPIECNSLDLGGLQNGC
ncbi:hypothetical protein E2C01_035154 [Portunus trituberculatus]|uniref:Uncharacterized protein n=1 Tax=Portunus trituberculatus TaxID=210409 RepID=A0A5B7F7K4_PORTR|nr:hypothetical protein [Portunus trituberculatus]